MSCIPINNLCDIRICYSIFACSNRVSIIIRFSKFCFSVKQLEYFSKNCRCITTIYLFNNKDIFLLWIIIRIMKNIRKRTWCELVAYLPFLINIRQNLSDEIRICIIRMENQTFNICTLLTIFMFYCPTLT